MQKLWRVMRRVLKWSGITVFGLLALALLLFAAAFIINAHDEQLSPQARALLTPPATENLLAAQTERRIQGARDPATFFRTRPEPAAAVVSLPTGLSAWTLLLTYNPGGKVLATIGDASYAEHPPRAWDAAAVQRLVRLGYEIRRQKIAADAIPTFLSEHPEWSTHPADGRPSLWDARTGELRIQTLAKQPPDRRFSAPVWQAATTN
jgi:hypothetical protein